MMNIDDTNGPKMPRVDVDWQGCGRKIRNQALEEAAAIFDKEASHDWGGIEYSELVGIPISNRDALVMSAKRAEENARMIRALKT